MLIIPKQKRLFSIFAVLLISFTFNFNNYGQCGVYLKRVFTDKFPYSGIHLDKSEDMTGDGIPDLILSREASGVFLRNSIFISPNNGNGSFGAPIIINAPSQAPFYDEYLIGDVNGDSRKDILTVFEYSPNSVLVYLNNGNGTFTPQTIFNAPQIGRPIYLLDVNNDGKADYFGFTNSGEFRYSLGNGNGTFSSPVTLSSPAIAYPGDFNNDGAIDFINSRNLFMNQGNGTFTSTDIGSVTNNQLVIGINDYNGDGKSDFLIGTTSGFAIFKKTASSFERTDYIVPIAQSSIGRFFVGNFSGNSAPDILYDVRYANRKIVFTNDGSGNFTSQEYTHNFANGNTPYHESLVDDFDIDGKDDLVQITSGTSNSTLLLKDTTSITFQKNVCNRPGQPRIVDFDRSGTTDFSFWKPLTGAWSYQTSGDSVRQTETINWGLGSLGDIPVPGDFDGDGITDRAVYRDSTGIWYIRRSSDLIWFAFQFGQTGDKPVAADYDGDTISDIAVWRPSDGNWYIWSMGTQQISTVRFGSNGDKPVPADFDGDFKTDVAVFRPSTGVWYYLKSSDANYSAIHWGLSSDKPMPADFDGDGNADIAVYRESDNQLYILKSYDSSFAAYQWGISQDMPQIGDFDGDFVDDLGVYRPSTKRWWVTDRPYNGPIFGDENIILTSSILRIE